MLLFRRKDSSKVKSGSGGTVRLQEEKNIGGTRQFHLSFIVITAIVGQSCLMVTFKAAFLLGMESSMSANDQQISLQSIQSKGDEASVESSTSSHGKLPTALRIGENNDAAAAAESSTYSKIMDLLESQLTTHNDGSTAAIESSTYQDEQPMHLESNILVPSTTSLEQPWPKPNNWETYTYYKMYRHFECKSRTHDQTKPLPTLEEYQLFRDKYKEHVDQEAEFDDSVPPTMGYAHNGGGPPPYYAGHTDDGKGRGLFASRDIKKGEFVHDGTYNDAPFLDGISFKRFVFDLPRNNSCDMLKWCWTQKLEEHGKFQILCTFNISILMNGSHSRANIMPVSSTSQRFFATRDIRKDEEILMDYSVYETRWDKVGLDD